MNLHDKIKNAVNHRLAVAVAASVDDNGATLEGEHWRWECVSCDTPIPITDVTVLDLFLECPRCESVGVGVRSVERYQSDYVREVPHLVTGGEEIRPIDGAHITLNDPAFTIRACQADLERLHEHVPCDGTECPTTRGESHAPWCHACSSGVLPCPEYRRLATVYEIEEDGDVQDR